MGTVRSRPPQTYQEQPAATISKGFEFAYQRLDLGLWERSSYFLDFFEELTGMGHFLPFLALYDLM
jgi:hypothetical protein